MTDRLKEFVDELREHWDDHYWWANHLALRMALVTILIGALELLFVWLKTRVAAAAEAV